MSRLRTPSRRRYTCGRRGWLQPIRAAVFVAVASAPVLPSSAGQEQQPPPAQPPFRTGTSIIRVDAVVIDRQGNPVTSLTADDFELYEDGRPQTITSFKFVSATGEPSDDRSLPIRSPQHAAAEAARDDVRTFLIFWDEYHIEQFVSASRGREALTRAVLEEFGPTDLVGLMDPLTPTSAIELSRDRRALAERVRTLVGRLGVFLPLRSAIEEEHLRRVLRPEQAQVFRTQVTITALKAAMAHLGTLREGGKTLLVVTEGLAGLRSAAGRDPSVRLPQSLPVPGLSRLAGDAATALDLVRTANDSNTAVHVIDPRGLQVARPVDDTILEVMAHGSGGDLHRTNDIPAAFRRVVKQASASYLLGYTNEMLMDGRFHEIKVRVKRRGVDVRARAGYWAPRAEDVERAKTSAAAAVLPAALGAAFASLTSPAAPRLVDVWMGTRRVADGRGQVTLAWTHRAGAAARPANVSVIATSEGKLVFEGRVEPGGTTLDVPAGVLQVAIRVLDDEGEILDRESAAIDVPAAAAPALGLGTPVLYRARTPVELRAILAPGSQPPVHAGRDFVRTERLFVRVEAQGPSAHAAAVTARLVDRRGATLVAVPVQHRSVDGVYEADLPLASIAAGEFVLAFVATSGGEAAEALVPFRIVR